MVESKAMLKRNPLNQFSRQIQCSKRNPQEQCNVRAQYSGRAKCLRWVQCSKQAKCLKTIFKERLILEYNTQDESNTWRQCSKTILEVRGMLGVSQTLESRPMLELNVRAESNAWAQCLSLILSQEMMGNRECWIRKWMGNFKNNV